MDSRRIAFLETLGGELSVIRGMLDYNLERRIPPTLTPDERKHLARLREQTHRNTAAGSEIHDLYDHMMDPTNMINKYAEMCSHQSASAYVINSGISGSREQRIFTHTINLPKKKCFMIPMTTVRDNWFLAVVDLVAEEIFFLDPTWTVDYDGHCSRSQDMIDIEWKVYNKKAPQL